MPQRYIVDRVARTTTYEIDNDGQPTQLYWRSRTLISDARASLLGSIIGQTLNFYDGAAPSMGSACSARIGDYGALVRTETWCSPRTSCTSLPERRDGADVRPRSRRIWYRSGPPAWTADYPQEFRDLLPRAGGLHFQAGGRRVTLCARLFRGHRTAALRLSRLTRSARAEVW